MADQTENIGAVSVQITADASQLNQAFSQAQTQAESSGRAVADAFVNGVRSIDQAEQAVKTATSNLADAQKQLASFVVAGNQEAIQAVSQYEAELQAAQATLAAFQAQQQAATASTQQMGSAASTAAAQVQQLQTAASGGGGQGGGITAVGQAAASAVPPINQAGAAASSASVGMFRLYAVLSLVRKGLTELDKFRESEEELSHLAAATGVAADRLAAFQAGIGLAGGNAEQFGQVLNRLARAMETAEQGSAKMQDDLQRLGVTSKDPIEAFYQIADAVHNTSDRFEALGVASQVLGRNAVDLVGIFASGADALKRNAADSSEVSQAQAAAIKSAHDLTVVEAELNQVIKTVTAESFPALVPVIQAVASAFAAAILPVKLFFTTLIDSTLIGVQSLETFGDVSSDVLTGKFKKATVDAAVGLQTLTTLSKKLAGDVKQDWSDTAAFISKIQAGAPAAAGPGAGKPFPKPAPTGDKVGEAEQLAEVAHNNALRQMAREQADTILAIRKGSDDAEIESIQSKHVRAVQLAAEDVAIAQARQTQMAAIDRQERDDNVAALNEKLALAQKDKNAATESVHIQAQIQAEQDKFAERQLAQIENVAKAQAHLGDVVATQAREWKSELDKLATEAETILDKMAADTATAKTKIADIQQQRDTRTGEVSAKGQGDVNDLAIQRQKLELERAYGLEVVHSRAEEVAYLQRIAALDEQARNAKIAGLQAEMAIAKAAQQEAAAESANKLAAGDNPAAVSAAQEEARAESKAVELQQQINVLRAQGDNATIAAQTKVLELITKQKLASELKTDIQQIPGSLGNAAAKGIIDGKGIGQDIRNALKGIGQEMLGQVFSRLIASILFQTGVTTANTAAQTANAAASAASAGASIANATATGIHTGATLASTTATLGHIIATEAQTIATNLNTLWLQIKSFFGFADGGVPPVGVPSLGGERGPELAVPHGGGPVQVIGAKGPQLFVPKGPTTIIPNHKVGAFMSSLKGYADGTSDVLHLPSVVPAEMKAGYSSSGEQRGASSRNSYSSSSTHTGDMHFHAHGMTNPDHFIDHVMRKLPEKLKTRTAQFSAYSR